jgi:hypothetical protein
MPKAIFRVLLAVLLSTVVFSWQSMACTFHQTNFGSLFEETYPGSLSVVAAVAAARSDGRLPVAQLETGNLGLMRASFALRRLGSRLAMAGEAPQVDFFVILAGQQLWTYYQATRRGERKRYNVHVHTAAPTLSAPVIVTSYYVVEGLQDGALTFAEAVDAGLVRIRDDKSGQVAAMFGEALNRREDLPHLLPTLLGDLTPYSPVPDQP